MPFVRKIKKRSGTYLALVESKRVDGKPRQHVIKYLGKEVEGKVVRKTSTSDMKVTSVKRHLDVEIIDHLANELGLKQLLPTASLVLVYSQLLERPSLNKMEQWLNETDILEILQLEKISTFQLYEALEQLQDTDFSKAEESIARIFSSHETKKALVVDVTDTYFEGDSFDEKPRRGKDGKVRKLLQIAIAVSEKWGFPIFHRTFDGNINGSKLFREMLSSLASLGYSGVILDRGFYSTRNIQDMLALKMSIICGVIRNDNFNHILEGIDKGTLYRKENRVSLRNTHVYCTSVDYLGGRLLVVYNPYSEVVKRERLYDSGGGDEEAVFLGYSLIYHNTGLADCEVVRRYFDKDVVERAFRQMKGVLSLRPVRVWLRSHVEAHVKVCYVAYAILCLLQYRISSSGMGVSAVEALDVLRTGYRVKLKDQTSGLEWDALVELTSEQEKLRRVVYKKG
jgi:transposase